MENIMTYKEAFEIEMSKKEQKEFETLLHFYLYFKRNIKNEDFEDYFLRILKSNPFFEDIPDYMKKYYKKGVLKK